MRLDAAQADSAHSSGGQRDAPCGAGRLMMERDLLTTAEAAAYCGFKSSSTLRKAKMDGRLTPVGRRGGRGTWMWRRADLDGFLAGHPRVSVTPGRPGTPPQEDAD